MNNLFFMHLLADWIDGLLWCCPESILRELRWSPLLSLHSGVIIYSSGLRKPEPHEDRTEPREPRLGFAIL
jgi:hypothetical protein